MLYGCAENHRSLVLDVIQPRFDDQCVPFSYTNLDVEIPNIILHAVKAYLRHIDIRMNSDAPHVHKRTDLYRRLNVQLVRRIFEDLENIRIVRTLRRCGKSQ